VAVQNNMTNFNFIENANVVLKSVAANLRSGNKEYTSISRVLKDIQRKDMLKAGYGEVFKAVGLEAGEITPADFFAAVPQSMHGKDKKGEDFVGIWGWKVTERDKDGKATKKEAVLRKVTAWTPNKLFKVLAQAQELNK
jgi:hypothetical protein